MILSKDLKHKTVNKVMLHYPKEGDREAIPYCACIVYMMDTRRRSSTMLHIYCPTPTCKTSTCIKKTHVICTRKKKEIWRGKMKRWGEEEPQARHSPTRSDA